MFSAGCGAARARAVALRPPLPPPARAAPRPGTIVSSLMFALARPPQAIIAMFSLLLRFWPRRNAGAPLITPAARAPPTNSRRVI